MTEKEAPSKEVFSRAYGEIISDIEKPDPKDFGHIYRQADIEEDRATVADIKGRFQNTEFETEQKKWASLFETIICDQIELGDWLGSEVMTLFTSEYDDLTHGVDGVIEIGISEDEFSHIGFDCTFSLTALEKKLSKIKNTIDKGVLNHVKYFSSPHTEEKKKLKNIPLVVLATDKQMIKELADLTVERKHKELNQHQVKYIVVEQILFQLYAFRAYVASRRTPLFRKVRERERLLQILDQSIEAVTINVQGTLDSDFDIKILSESRHLKELRRKIFDIFVAPSEIVAPPYTYALEAVRDINRLEEGVQENIAHSSETEEKPEDVRFVNFVSEIREKFGENIGHTRIMRYMRQEAEKLSGIHIYKKEQKTIGDPKTNVIYLTPDLANRVRERFVSIAEIRRPLEGWLTNRQLYGLLYTEGIAIKVDTLRTVAQQLKGSSEDIKKFQSENNRVNLYYSPQLVELIMEFCRANKGKKLSATEVLPYEDGWESINDITTKFSDKISSAVVRVAAYALAEEYPEERKIMKKPGEHPFPRYSPRLQQMIEQKISETVSLPIPPEGAMTAPEIAEHFDISKKTIKRLLIEVIKQHPEWKKKCRIPKKKPQEYYLKEALDSLRPELEYIKSLSEPHPGEMTFQAAARYITQWLKTQFVGEVEIAPISDVTLKKKIKEMIPEDVTRKQLVPDRRTPDGNYYPHLSQSWISYFKQEFKEIYETPIPSEGEVTKKELNETIQARFNVGKSKADDLIEQVIRENAYLRVKRRRPFDSYLMNYYISPTIIDRIEKWPGPQI